MESKIVFFAGLDNDTLYYKITQNNRICYTLNISGSVYKKFDNIDDTLEELFQYMKLDNIDELFSRYIEDNEDDIENIFFNTLLQTKKKHINNKILQILVDKGFIFVSSNIKTPSIFKTNIKYIYIINDDIYEKYKDILKLKKIVVK